MFYFVHVFTATGCIFFFINLVENATAAKPVFKWGLCCTF